MPSSTHKTISYVCGRIITLKPQSVLDIGVGFGKYGFLAREYAGGFPLPTEVRVPILVDGIEIYEPYIQLIHKLLYDTLYVGDATKLIKTLGVYDLILCVDMLEHLQKEIGILFLKDVKQHSKVALIVLPTRPSRQVEAYGNEYERHVATWSVDELRGFGKVVSLKDKAFILEME